MIIILSLIFFSLKKMTILDCKFSKNVFITLQCTDSKRRTYIYLWHDQLQLWQFWLWALCQDTKSAQGEYNNLFYSIRFGFFDRLFFTAVCFCLGRFSSSPKMRLHCVVTALVPSTFRCLAAICAREIERKGTHRIFTWNTHGVRYI